MADSIALDILRRHRDKTGVAVYTPSEKGWFWPDREREKEYLHRLEALISEIESAELQATQSQQIRR